MRWGGDAGTCDAAVVAVFLAAAGGCVAGPRVDAPVAAPRQVDTQTRGDQPETSPPPYLGSWAGITSQGFPLSFTIDQGDPDAGLTFLAYAWRLPGCDRQDHVRFEDAPPIRERRVAVRVEGPGSLLDLALALDDDRARGNLDLTLARVPEAPRCVGRAHIGFTANRQPE